MLKKQPVGVGKQHEIVGNQQANVFKHVDVCK